MALLVIFSNYKSLFYQTKVLISSRVEFASAWHLWRDERHGHRSYPQGEGKWYGASI